MMMRKLGYSALSLYLLLVGLLTFIPSLLIPSKIMGGLALLAAFFIFVDSWSGDRN